MEDSVRLEAEVAELKDQIAKLKAKDRMHLEETKRSVSLPSYRGCLTFRTDCFCRKWTCSPMA